jgi:hypothetical protein
MYINQNLQPIPATYNDGFSYYETISKMMNELNQMIDSVNTANVTFEDIEAKKLSIIDYMNDIKNKRLLNETGDFTGSWFGIKKPMYADPGIAGVVDKNNTDIEALVNEMLTKVSSPNIKSIRQNVDSFEYSIDNTHWLEVKGTGVESALNVKNYGAKGDAIINDSYQLVSGTNDFQAFKDALGDAILNGRNLFIPQGIYYISSSDLLKIVSDKELRLHIYGEEQKTVLVSDTGIFSLSSVLTPPSNTEYTQRIRQVTFSNLIMKGIPQTNGTKQGTAIKIYGFGYINFNNVEMWNFAKGLEAIDGSELIMHNGVIAGNGIGLSLEKTDVDMANCSFYDTKIFNNDIDDIIAKSAREINFYSCVIVNNTGGTKLISKTIGGQTVACEIVNFVSCDIENYDNGVNSRGIEITGCHKTNFNNCLFAMPVPNKVTIDYEQAVVNFDGCLMAFPMYNAIAIKKETARINFYGCETGSFNMLTSGYAWRNCNLFDNTRLLNINADMEKGVTYPFAVSNLYTIDKVNKVTGTSSIKFEGATADPKYIELDLKGCIVEFIDVIWKSNDPVVSNCVHIFYEDGSELMAYSSNNEYPVQTFSNGFKRTLICMNDGRYNTKKIARITLSIGNTTQDWWIDSVRIIGQGDKRNKMYMNAKPDKGTWKKGDVVYQLNPSSGVSMGWTCSADGEPGSWVSNGNFGS